ISTSPAGTTIKGSLTSSPGTYRLEFFASPSTGPAFQGKTFLGSIHVTVPGTGKVTFTAPVLAALPAGSVVTATVTNTTSGAMLGDTSQFSQAATPTLVVHVSPSKGIFLGTREITLSAQVRSGPTPINTGVITFSMIPAGGGAAVVTFNAAVMNGRA